MKIFFDISIKLENRVIMKNFVIFEYSKILEIMREITKINNLSFLS